MFVLYKGSLHITIVVQRGEQYNENKYNIKLILIKKFRCNYVFISIKGKPMVLAYNMLLDSSTQDKVQKKKNKSTKII